MAESDIVSADQIVEPSAVPSIIEQFQGFLTILQQIEEQMKKNLTLTAQKSGGSPMPNNTSQLKDQHEQYQKALKDFQGLNDVQKKNLEVQLQINKAKTVYKDMLKAEESAYASLNNKYKQSAQSYRDVAAAQGLNSAEAKKLRLETNQLRAQLDGIDNSMGNYQRNVGNYKNKLMELSRTVKGFGALGRIVSGALGIDPEVFNGIREAGMGLRDLNHIQEGTIGHHKEAKVAIEEETAANEELEVANEAVGKSWMAAMGPIGWIIAGIAALAAGIAIYSAETKKAKEEEQERSVAVDGTIIIDKALRDSYNETIKTIHDVNTQYEVLTGNLSKTEGKLEDVRFANKIALQDIANETTKKLQEANGFWNQFKDALLDTITFSLQGEHALKDLIDVLKDDAVQKWVNSLKQAADEYKIIIEANDEALQKHKDNLKELETLKIQLIRNDRARDLAEINLKQEQRDKEIKEQKLAYWTEKKLLGDSEEEAGLERTLIKQKWRDEDEKKEQEAFDRRLKRLEEANKKWLDKQKELFTQLEKLDEKVGREAVASDTKKDELKVTTDKDKVSSNTDPNKKINLLRQQYQDEKKVLEDQFRDQLMDAQDHRDEELKQEGLTKNEKEQIWKDYYATVDNIELDSYNKHNELQHDETEKEKKIAEEKIKIMMDQEQTVLEALQKSLDNQNQARQNALQDQTAMLDTEAKVQADLAAAGKKNSLDQTLKAESDAAEQSKQLQRKAYEEKQWMDLAQIFFKSEQAYLTAGSNPTEAAGKALVAALLSKGIASAFSGGYATGVEGLKGPGTETSDSLVALLSKGESVITAKGTKKNPGLATAMNQDKVEEYFSKMYLPKMGVFKDKSNDEQVNQFLIESMIESFSSRIEKAINDKKEIVVSVDAAKRLVISETEKGRTVHRVQQEWPIIR